MQRPSSISLHGNQQTCTTRPRVVGYSSAYGGRALLGMMR